MFRSEEAIPTKQREPIRLLQAEPLLRADNGRAMKAAKVLEVEKVWMSRTELKKYLGIKDNRTLEKILDESNLKIKISIVGSKPYFLKSSVDQYFKSRQIN